VFLFVVLGASVGVTLTALAGETCFDRVGGGGCGLTFLAWNLSSPIAIAAAALLGGALGLGLASVILLAANRKP
jgi:uncharacterized membrane protein YbhN (UPF0104 family)